MAFAVGLKVQAVDENGHWADAVVKGTDRHTFIISQENVSLRVNELSTFE